MIKTPPYSNQCPRFSRAWWIGAARGLFWVVVVTALIWIYADMKLSEQKTFTTTIRVVPREGFVLESAERVEITFTVEGGRGALDRFGKALAEGEVTITCEVDDKTEAPLVKDILIDNRDIREEGLAVVSASPGVLPARVDRIVTIPGVPVKLADPVGAILEGEPVIDPPKVTVRAADRQWREILRKMGPDEQPVLMTKRQDLSDKQPGKPIRLEPDPEIVPVIKGVSVSVEPKTVAVTVSIRQRRATKTLTVGVQVQTPPTWAADETWNKFVLVGENGTNEWRKSITVTGPRTDLDKLDAKDVRAYIVLQDRHKQPSDTPDQETVILQFPEGLNVEVSGKSPVVRFKLRPRPASPSPPGG